MAESNDDNNDEKSYPRKTNKNKNELSHSSDENEDVKPEPDIGLGATAVRSKKNMDLFSGAGPSSSSQGLPKREDNPFSFKHFLNRDSNTSIPTGGARPKIYANIPRNLTSTNSACSPSTSCNPPSPRLISNPELTSGLPDFVQDHLVVEQCYLASNSTPPSVLDLPEALPFDLPSTSNEAGTSKRLPDFLSDGPIHSDRRNDGCQPAEITSPLRNQNECRSSLRSKEEENECLKREVSSLRRQLRHELQRNEQLGAELASHMNREYQDVSGFEFMIKEMEEKIRRTAKRAMVAETKASKLKMEVKALNKELNELRSQSGPSKGNERVARVANELRDCASTAEITIRQLLGGVTNLRILADTLENKHNVEEDPSDFLDSDSNNEAGPAL